MRKIKTISVPPELGIELDKFDENWSAVACRAFERRIEELKAMKIHNAEDRVVARLRASKMKATEELYASGEIAGAAYVADDAEFLELERLEHWREQIGSNWWKLADTLSIESIAKVMTNGNGDEDTIVQNLREADGDDVSRAKWVEGFLDGVLSSFAKLKVKL